MKRHKLVGEHAKITLSDYITPTKIQTSKYKKELTDIKRNIPIKC